MSMFTGGGGQQPKCIESLIGFAPGPARELLVRPDPLEETPPVHMLTYRDDQDRAGVRDFYRVRFWLERNLVGSVVKVFCFACGACYLDTWDVAHYGERQRVRPVVDGGVVFSTGRADRACQCFAGRVHRSTMAKASTAEMGRAERESRDREIAAIVHRTETGRHAGLERNPFWVDLQRVMAERAKAFGGDGVTR